MEFQQLPFCQNLHIYSCCLTMCVKNMHLSSVILYNGGPGIRILKLMLKKQPYLEQYADTNACVGWCPI